MKRLYHHKNLALKKLNNIIELYQLVMKENDEEVIDDCKKN